MAILGNRAYMDTSTTGTGTITLGSAVAGYQSFAGAGITDGDVVPYVLVESNNWEIGTGTYTATGTTLSRSVTESTNAGSAINLAGNAFVFITPAADYLDVVSSTSKATPIDADVLGIWDSAAANILKKLTWANLKATLKTYFDSLYYIVGGADVAIADGGTGASTVSAARSNLNVDIAGTDNSTDVTLAGTGTYLSLAGQVITVDPITESDVSDLGTLAAMVADIGVSIQGYTTVLQNTTASFLTAQETKINYISITQAVDLDAIETRVNALDASVILMGTWDASVGTFPGSGTAQAGESWIVSVGGTVNGEVFTANDRIVAILDNASTTTYASNWHKLDYTDAVLSVAGKTGAVTLTESDITDLQSYILDVTGDNLSALADVTITSIAAGELLKWSGSAWINQTLAEAGVSAVGHTHLIANITDFTDNSTNWDTAYSWGDHASAGYLTALALGGLSDATITSVASGELLKWNGTAWINNTLSEAGIQAQDAALDDIAGITFAQGDLLYHDGTNIVKLAKGTASQVLTMNTGATAPEWAAASGGGGSSTTVLHVQDQKTNGTNAGTISGGSWVARILNTVVKNDITGASLASNKVTLPAGTYYFEGTAPAQKCGQHRLKIVNTTDSTDVVVGGNVRAATSVGNVQNASVAGWATITATKDFNMQHRSNSSAGSTGLGQAASFGATEVYADLRVWKVG